MEMNNLRVGIVGTGTMGKGIAQLFATSSIVTAVVLKGTTLERAVAAKHSLEVFFERLVSKKRMSELEALACVEKIAVISDYSGFSDCDCIVEAVAEEMNAKRQVFEGLAAVVGEQTILASNTSSLSITQIAGWARHPQNVVGIHFFNPAPVMKLAEVIESLLTSKSTIDWSVAFVTALEKEPVVVKEAPGFIVNRMLIPMINEAIGILAEDVASAEEIDKAMRLGANHPIGPLALADLIGNDVNLSIMQTLHDETGDPKYRAHPLLRKMVRANRLGRKTGHGFYKY